MEDLTDLRGLYTDLTNLSTSSLASSNRLWLELEAFLPDFRNVLDTSSRSNESRDEIKGKRHLTVDGAEYELNEQFEQTTLVIADELDIDEIEAGRLLLSSQPESHRLGQPAVHTAISRFQERRFLLLECLRLVLHESSTREAPDLETNGEDDFDAVRLQERLRETVALILDVKTGPPSNGSVYARKCLSAMNDVERSLEGISERANKVSIVGSDPGSIAIETLEVERTSLVAQHESLGAIICYLFKAGYTSSEDLRQLIKTVKTLKRFDSMMLHYLPAVSASFAQHGSSPGSLRDARSLNQYIVYPQDSHEPWHLQVLHAAIIILWLAEYSGWYLNPGAQSPLEGVDLAKESDERARVATNALNDGALEFILAVCAGTTLSDEWHDPARQEVVAQLLRDTTGLSLEGDKISSSLRNLLMDQLIGFSESWITNMPDTIRRLKAEEDDRRLKRITFAQEGVDPNLQPDADGSHSHLECFLVIISFAFEHQFDYSLDFWTPEGNFFGFLQWASKRQTVPRVSAFCEMLCSISEGEDCAKSAHAFLRDETQNLPGRFRKSPSMNYSQMFDELLLYSDKVKERYAVSQTLPQMRKVKPTEMNELESPVMLACYLRLMAHMCRESLEARNYLLQHRMEQKLGSQPDKATSYSLVDIILELGRGPIPGYLRASIFRTIKALLVDKTAQSGNEMWFTLDTWITGGGLGLPSSTRNPQPMQLQIWSERDMFQTIGGSFDQMKDFVALLQSLVSPSMDSSGLNDSLPFPENLGSARRMPGIDPYIDFALGQVFAKKIQELFDESQIQLLRYNCLDLIATCLETFNEDLVAVANQSTIAVDSVIASSSLAVYIQRHPFARVMEWLFSEEVIACLFACTHQRVSDISQADSSSVLVAGLARSIDILNMVLRLQPTYLEIVRPLLKQSSGPRNVIPNSALASFEDSIATNIQIIADLSVYCGAGHEGLTVKSLELLQRLSVSRRLHRLRPSMHKRHHLPNSILETLDAEVDSWQIGQSLASLAQLDIRELEVGPLAKGYIIKDSVLQFLEGCLAAIPSTPNVAHFFLGFRGFGNTLDVDPDSLFADGLALLHSIIHLAQDYPEGSEGTMRSWMLHIKRISLQVLKHLWASPLSSFNTLAELRKQNFLAAQFSTQDILTPQTYWDGLLISDPAFLRDSAADALTQFLQFRSLLFDYAVMELRSSSHERYSSHQNSILSTLSGRSVEDSGETVPHVSVFDLFDFADVEIRNDIRKVSSSLITDSDLMLCVQETLNDRLVIFDLTQARQLIELSIGQMRRKGLITTPVEQETLGLEADTLLAYLHSRNNEALIQMSRSKALRSWVDLVTATIGTVEMGSGSRIQFILHALQVILPKLDLYIVNGQEEAMELARLAETLMDNIEAATQSPSKGRVGNVVNDRLFQLFRVSLQGIHQPGSPSALREVLYNICSLYLDRIDGAAHHTSIDRKNSLQVIVAAGEPLVNTICDDADAGQESCRLSALLMLNLIAGLAKTEVSGFLVDSFARINFFEALVDPMKHITDELQETKAEEIPLLLEFYGARLSLLLQLSQSRTGANHITNAGLFQAVRESGLFQVDPDLGIDFDNPKALRKYYDLVSSVTRVITSTVLTRGLYNEQTLYQLRNFLTEYRPNVVGIFKRHAGIGGSVPSELKDGLSALVKSYTALLSLVDFVDYEAESFAQKAVPRAFS